MVPDGGPRLSPQTCRNLIATCSNDGTNRNLLLPGAARISRLTWRKRSIRALSEPDKRCLAARPVLSVHRARSCGGEAHGRPRGGDVSRPDRGDRAEGRAVHRAAPSLNAHAADSDPAAGPTSAQRAAITGRRCAEPDEPALGLSVSYPLSVRHRPLPRGNANPAKVERWPFHRLPSRRGIAAGGRGDRAWPHPADDGAAAGAVREAARGSRRSGRLTRLD
jgi:hypothetical protein